MIAAFYVLVGLAGMIVFGRTLHRRFRRWRRMRDRRAFRELTEALAFCFVSFQIFALTIGAWLDLPRIWLILGASVAAGAFVAAGFVYDQEDAAEP